MTQDISYFVSGYIDQSYFVELADAEITLGLTSTVQANNKRVRTSQTALASTFTVSAIVSKFHYIDESAIIESTATLAGPSIGLDAIGDIILAPTLRTRAVIVGDLNG